MTRRHGSLVRVRPKEPSSGQWSRPPGAGVAAAEAFLWGIERRIADGLNPNIGTVASVFISRWDAVGHGHGAPRAAWTARHRHRQAHLQGLPGAARFAALAKRLQCRRPHAAPAL